MPFYRGSDADEAFTGTQGDDSFQPGLGQDTIDGLAGYDKLQLNYSTVARSFRTNETIIAGAADGLTGRILAVANTADFVRIERILAVLHRGDDLVTIDKAALASGASIRLDGGEGLDIARLDLSGIEGVRVGNGRGNTVAAGAMLSGFEAFGLTLGLGRNKVRTGDTRDTVFTTEGGRNRIETGGGDDRIVSNATVDRIDGGAGSDTWEGIYVRETAALTFDDRTGRLSNGTTIVGIEKYDLFTGGGDDRFTVATASQFGIFAYGGRDSVDIDRTAVSLDTVVTLTGTDNSFGAFYGYLVAGGVSSSVFNVEEIGLRLGGGADRVTITGTASYDGSGIAIDGGGGRDALLLDLRFVPDQRLLADASGTIGGASGRFAGFETLDLSVGGGRNGVRTGAGDDTISSYGGVDTVDGGGGTDLWRGFYGGADAPLLFDDTAATILSNGTTLTRVERVAIATGAGDDRFAVTGRTVSVDGGAGTDALDIRYGALAAPVTMTLALNGGAVSGSVTGGATLAVAGVEQVTFAATARDDRVTIATPLTLGGQTISGDGGAGNDLLVYDNSGSVRQVIFTPAADGSVTMPVGTFTGFERYTVLGGAGADRLTGGAGDDALYGSTGNDFFYSTPGNDLFDGGVGSYVETLIFTSAPGPVRVSLAIAAPQDTGAGRDTILNVDRLVGSRFADMLTGDDGDNGLSGFVGDDTLTGGGGADVLAGDGGIDTMTGGDGADTFRFALVADAPTGTRIDTIADFDRDEGDRIDVSGIDPDAAVAGDQRFTFLGDTEFTGAGGTDYELRREDLGDGSWRIEGDVNHDGVADLAFRVVAPSAPEMGDFLL